MRTRWDVRLVSGLLAGGLLCVLLLQQRTGQPAVAALHHAPPGLRQPGNPLPPALNPAPASDDTSAALAGRRSPLQAAAMPPVAATEYDKVPSPEHPDDNAAAAAQLLAALAQLNAKVDGRFDALQARLNDLQQGLVAAQQAAQQAAAAANSQQPQLAAVSTTKAPAASTSPPAHNEHPQPRIPFPEFLAAVQAHLNGELSHDLLMQFMGATAANASQVRPWPAQPSANAPPSFGGGDDPQKAIRGFLVRNGFLVYSDGALNRPAGQLMHGVWAPQRCLEQNVTQDGSTLVLRHCSLGGSFQEWILREDGRITGGVNPTGDDCFFAPAEASPDARVQTTECDHDRDSPQLFTFVFQGPWQQVGLLVHRKTGLCVSVDDVRPESKLPIVILQPCTQRCNQLWLFKNNRSGIDALPIGSNDTTPRPNLDYLRLPAPGAEPVAKAVSAEPKPRIVCWIMTNPDNHGTKALTVNATWGRHCDRLLFMTTVHQAGLDTVVLHTGEREDRHFLWRKSILSWSFLYQHLLNDSDWFMRADDDTWVNFPSLRQFLSSYNPDEPHFFGRRLLVQDVHFCSGGSTNIISRKTLKLLGEAIIKRGHKVLRMGDTFADDLELGATLEKLGVLPEDSRDEEKRERFAVLSLMDERKSTRKAEPSFWYWNYSYYAPQELSMSSSPTWIASHYITPQDMLAMDALNQLGCEGAGQQPWDPSATFSTARLP